MCSQKYLKPPHCSFFNFLKQKYINQFSSYFKNINISTILQRHMFISRIMVWNNEKDELLCREVLLMEPYQYKARSWEQGNVWKQIADALNLISTENTFFRVDAHVVRERCSLLTNCQPEKGKSELKRSGISPEDTPLDNAIKNIINRMRECEEEQENQDNENIRKSKERKAAEDMRLTAMENLAESKTRKRVSLIEYDESPKNSKKQRSSGSDTLQYLREKAENDRKLKKTGA